MHDVWVGGALQGKDVTGQGRAAIDLASRSHDDCALLLAWRCGGGWATLGPPEGGRDLSPCSIAVACRLGLAASTILTASI